ncbi:predicted protein [Naegleria gruberi]|uniref:Predicted protein n=1 Tax=Naegleria gruberi TaxID=5762 RepID=D2V8M8_NAEGR|nr:uncharacterized protein NAEGRDRAFT_32025 [Naegleria gruberi]EFC46716.1 predicted protein [Naegleria gruberi]|eukprot:XP_002679460.1 predicted protein [Naegleria gruberi strain NEG-M]
MSLTTNSQQENVTKLFTGSSHTEMYAKYRPTYPDELFEQIVALNCSKDQKKLNILDVGCGSGQASFSLAKYAKLLVGVDPSENQIKQAKQKESQSNIQGCKFDFIVGTDVNLLECVNQLESFHQSTTCENQFDLIVVAQSLHWFNFETFFNNVSKMLAPNGVFAAWTYTLNSFEGEHGETATNTLNNFYNEEMWKPGYWAKERKYVDDEYRSIEQYMPYPSNHKRLVLDYRKSMPLAAYISYISTWSSIESFGKKNGEEKKKQLLEKLKTDLMNDLKLESDSDEVQVLWKIHTITTTRK